jgi:3-oxoadipate enol-lactonase
MLVIASETLNAARQLAKPGRRGIMNRMGAITTSRGQVGLLEAGAGGEATPIIFLHGVGSDKSVWEPQLRHFGQLRRAVAFDYPGYGESAPRPGATRGDYAAAILAGMDALEIGRAHVCGLSLGGIIAMVMQAQAPGRCASLILADTFAVHPDGPGIYQRSVDASATIGMRALAEQRVGMLLGDGAPAELRRQVVETMAAIDPAAYRLGAEAVWLADLREAAAATAVPTLVLCGEEDRVTPPALSHELASLIADAELQILAGAGHLANAEQPVEFNRAVDAFLAGLPQ